MTKLVRKYWVPKFKGTKVKMETILGEVKKQYWSDQVQAARKKYGAKINPHNVASEMSEEVLHEVIKSVVHVLENRIERDGDFVLVGVGKFYLLKGKSGQTFIKFNSKYKI